MSTLDLADEADEGLSPSETFQKRIDRYALEHKLDLKNPEVYDRVVKQFMRATPKLAFARLMEPEAQKQAVGGDR